MSLPTKEQILTLDYSADGSLGVNVAAKSGIEFGGLDYSADGSPFYGTEDIELEQYLQKIIILV